MYLGCTGGLPNPRLNLTRTLLLMAEAFSQDQRHHPT
jgi:hypothetical protein